MKLLQIVLFILFASFGLQVEQLAFPIAEGFGRYTMGGRGGLVYKVTNLNDDGEGSLRNGILNHGPRTIVFEVSRTINLKSGLDIDRGDLTIAGQTAPGEGITIKGYPVKVKANNVIIRYLRFRMGDINEVEDDAFSGRDQENVIIDHCSICWATGENASFYWNKNVTMQWCWCMVAEALNESVHSIGEHGYGRVWGGENVSFHHNLIMNNNSRNPRFSGSGTTPNSDEEFVDFRNNAIYNWEGNSIYGGENGRYNIVNNYFKPGPATEKSKAKRILEPNEPYGKFYIENNYVENALEVTNWKGVVTENFEALKLQTEINVDNVKTESATEAYKSVIK